MGHGGRGPWWQRGHDGREPKGPEIASAARHRDINEWPDDNDDILKLKTLN